MEMKDCYSKELLESVEETNRQIRKKQRESVLNEDFDIVKEMKKKISEHMEKYAAALQEELGEKYREEFNQRMRKERVKVVSEVIGGIAIEKTHDPMTLATNIILKV